MLLKIFRSFLKVVFPSERCSCFSTILNVFPFFFWGVFQAYFICKMEKSATLSWSLDFPLLANLISWTNFPILEKKKAFTD